MISLFLFMGGMSSCHLGVSGSVVDVMVRPGDNITLYCDCTLSSGVLVVWYRNCSHLNQPTLVLKLRTKYLHDMRNDPLSWMTPLPRFQFVRNDSSNSYDLIITNITGSDEGLYFCGTEMTKLEDGHYLKKAYVYRYGNISRRIVFSSSSDGTDSSVSPYFPVSWMLLIPALTVLFSNICLICVYHLYQKSGIRSQTRTHQDDGLFLTTVVFRTMDRKKIKMQL